MGDDDYADGGFVADEFETNGHFYIPHSGTNSTLSFDALGIPFDLAARQTGPTGIEALLTSPEYRNWSLTGRASETGYALNAAYKIPPERVPGFMEKVLRGVEVTASVKGPLTSGRRDFNVGANLPVGAGSLGASYNRQLNPGAPDSSNFKVDFSHPMFRGIINAYANRAKVEGSPDRDSIGASYNRPWGPGIFSADFRTGPEETRGMFNYRLPL